MFGTKLIVLSLALTKILEFRLSVIASNWLQIELALQNSQQG